MSHKSDKHNVIKSENKGLSRKIRVKNEATVQESIWREDDEYPTKSQDLLRVLSSVDVVCHVCSL